MSPAVEVLPLEEALRVALEPLRMGVLRDFQSSFVRDWAYCEGCNRGQSELFCLDDFNHAPGCWVESAREAIATGEASLASVEQRAEGGQQA